MKIHGFTSILYGWRQRYLRDGKEPELERILSDCSASGLDAVEIDPTPENLRLVRANELSVSGAYVGEALHKPYAEIDVERILAVAERVANAGGANLVINANPKGTGAHPQDKTEEEVKRQGDNLTRIADEVEPLGLKLCFHNHASNHFQAENDLRSVVEFSGPNVGLCVDTGWAYTAGWDPLEWIRKYSNRVSAFHLRNQFGADPAEDLTEGEIDMASLVQLLAEIDYEGWLGMELWHPKRIAVERSMVEDVRRSIDYLQGLLCENSKSELHE